jgi:hypothetical protein
MAKKKPQKSPKISGMSGKAMPMGNKSSVHPMPMHGKMMGK